MCLCSVLLILVLLVIFGLILYFQKSDNPSEILKITETNRIGLGPYVDDPRTETTPQNIPTPSPSPSPSMTGATGATGTISDSEVLSKFDRFQNQHYFGEQGVNTGATSALECAKLCLSEKHGPCLGFEYQESGAFCHLTTNPNTTIQYDTLWDRYVIKKQ